MVVLGVVVLGSGGFGGNSGFGGWWFKGVVV